MKTNAADETTNGQFTGREKLTLAAAMQHCQSEKKAKSVCWSKDAAQCTELQLPRVVANSPIVYSLVRAPNLTVASVCMAVSQTR